MLCGKITRRLKATKLQQGKANNFLKVADKFIYPIIYLLENYALVSKHALLLSKGLYSLALCLECASNHWQIQKFSKECFDLWARLKDFLGMISKMSDSDFEGEQLSETESRSRLSSLCMNLAFVVSKCKNLTQE